MMLSKLAVPFVLLAGCTAFAGASQAQPAAFGGPKMLIHGNYCGPGNNAPLPPVDALDAACARHDACTPDGGLPSKACNDRLQREAEMISRDPRAPQKERAMAGMIAAGAGAIPSSPDVASTGGNPDTTGAITRVSPDTSSMTSDDDSDDAE